MAKPQVEDGFTPIANEILEKLARMPLSPNQWRVLLCIIRKTYGFHKKVDYIANFQIGEATGLCKAVVSRCLHGLSDMQLIVRKGKYIGFQKDWEKWVGLRDIPLLKIKKQAKMRIVRTDGYIGIWHGAVEPEFRSMATKQGYILEHRLIMARSLGRCLESWEVVHHKDRNHSNNAEDNLELLPSQAAHIPFNLAQQKIKQLEAELAQLQTIVDDKLAVSPSTVAIRSTKVSSCAVTQKIKDTIQKIYILPDWINKDTWNDFLEMRRKKRAVPTEKAKELLIKELVKLKNEGNDPNEVLNQSIMRNYTGVFPLKNDIGKRPRGLPKEYTSDE